MEDKEEEEEQEQENEKEEKDNKEEEEERGLWHSTDSHFSSISASTKYVFLSG